MQATQHLVREPAVHLDLRPLFINVSLPQSVPTPPRHALASALSKAERSIAGGLDGLEGLPPPAVILKSLTSAEAGDSAEANGSADRTAEISFVAQLHSANLQLRHAAAELRSLGASTPPLLACALRRQRRRRRLSCCCYCCCCCRCCCCCCGRFVILLR